MENKIKVAYSKILQNDFWGQLLKNITVIFVGNNYASVLNLFSTFLILLILDADEYGIFIIGQSYMAVIDALINFQSWQGVIRYGAFALEEKNDNKLASVIKTGICIDGVTCVIGLIVGIIMVDKIAYIFHWDKTTQIVCILFSLEILFHIEGSVTGILRLFNRFNYIMYHSFIYATINFVSILVYYLMHGNDLRCLVIIYILTDIIKYCIYQIMGIIVIKRKVGLKKVVKAPFLGIKSDYFHYTIWSNLSATADVPIKYFDVFFLSLISTHTVAAYKIFKQIVNIMGVLVTPISQVIMPQFSELIAKGEKKLAYEREKQLKKTFIKVSIPLSIMTLVVSVFVFRYFKNGLYYSDLYILFWLLLLNIGTFSNVGIHPLFSAYGFSKESAIITLVANCIYILVGVVTIYRFKVLGVIFATCIQFIITVSAKKKIIEHRIGEEKCMMH